ncbi:MAG: hypothetical protein M5U19_21600 [Microthrixaceae bacterium]|nr:hypothetical protein [Microthrixaceae bacterium]
MRGSAVRFRYFWRPVVWLMLNSSPSQANHTGLFWGSPSGPMVATIASVVLERMSACDSGMTLMGSSLVGTWKVTAVIPMAAATPMIHFTAMTSTRITARVENAVMRNTVIALDVTGMPRPSR